MKLLSPFPLGKLELGNRVIMAPMTRSRAIDSVPNALMREYYAQRAGAGLIITEGTAPAPEALGYPRIPGLFSAEQAAGWRSVTAAVHAAGGRIFAQLMHVGRIAHPLNLPAGARILAPSPLRAAGAMYTDAAGHQPHPEPEAMTLSDVRAVREGFASAATRALDAGFDGVELHAANGYLLEQFLHPHTNRREDAYGGSDRARNRFAVEVAAAAADAIGAERVGMRLSPYGTLNDLAQREDATRAYAELAGALPPLAYLHVVRSTHPQFPATLGAIRTHFAGALMLNGGYDAQSGEAALLRGEADLISYGRPFIANPDYVERIRQRTPVAVPEPATFYTPSAAGYTDYPRSAQVH
jgi:N-ethylmaleimide reductase